MDLLDWFRGVHPWRKLPRLLTRLPPESRYKRAVEDDDDIAAQRAAAGIRPRARPTLVDWTPIEALRADIKDGFASLQRAVTGPYVKSLPPFKPAARPRTAADRYADRAEQHIHDSIVAKVLPGG